MHNLCEYIKRELDVLDDKSATSKLTMNEIEYADLLYHLLKTMKVVYAMDDGGYSVTYSDYSERGYDRGYHHEYPRYSRGGYSRASKDDFRSMLQETMDAAPDEQTRQKIQRFMTEMDR